MPAGRCVCSSSRTTAGTEWRHNNRGVRARAALRARQNRSLLPPHLFKQLVVLAHVPHYHCRLVAAAAEVEQPRQLLR